MVDTGRDELITGLALNAYCEKITSYSLFVGLARSLKGGFTYDTLLPMNSPH